MKKINTIHFVVAALVLLSGVTTAYAQDDHAQDCVELMQDAVIARKNRNFTDAINYYIAIRGYCPDSAAAADGAMIEVFTAIEQLRRQADRDRQRALIAKDSLDALLKEAQLMDAESRRQMEEIAQAKLESERQRENLKKEIAVSDSLRKEKEGLVNAFFFDDSMAIAYRNQKFGFVTKEGNPRIQYQYDKAENFMQIGFARVSRGGKPYLIDRNGREDLRHGSEIFDTPKFGFDLKVSMSFGAPDTAMLFEPLKHTHKRKIGRFRFQRVILKSALFAGLLTPKYMRRQTHALDLSGGKVGYLNKRIFKLDSLQILLLSDYKLATVDPRLSRLKQLRYLDLSHNQLTYLQEGFSRLENLIALDISSNGEMDRFPEVLFKMPNLRALYLQGTKIPKTDELKERLRRELPNCRVIFD